MPALCDRLVSRWVVESHVIQFLESFAHDVNVIDITESDSTVCVSRVRATVLIATTLELIGACIEQWTRIIDLYLASFVVLRAIAATYLSDKILITFIPAAKEEGARLRASPD